MILGTVFLDEGSNIFFLGKTIHQKPTNTSSINHLFSTLTSQIFVPTVEQTPNVDVYTNTGLAHDGLESLALHLHTVLPTHE